MRFAISSVAARCSLRAVACLLAITAGVFACRGGHAEEEATPEPNGAPVAAAPCDADRQPAVNGSGPEAPRSGGLLEQAFNYHRQPQLREVGAPAGYVRAGGWYGYGFPVQSYRWGYFGAERNYPRVIWHTGYYGDCCRTAYRYGY